MLQKYKVYPPVAAVENVYNFSNLSQYLKMGINTGRIGKISSSAQNFAFSDMHNRFNSGNLDIDSFYVFTESEFVPSEFVNYYKNIALRTIDEKTSWGTLDGYTFIAPNLKKCVKGTNLKATSMGFGPSSSYIFVGGPLEFGSEKISDKYVLTGVKIENQGIIPQDDSFKITLILDKNLSLNYFKIDGKILDSNNSESKYGVFFNEKLINYCVFASNLSRCEFTLNDLNLTNQILEVTLKPMNLESKINSPSILIAQIELN